MSQVFFRMQKLIERSFFEGAVGIEKSNQGRMMHKLYAYGVRNLTMLFILIESNFKVFIHFFLNTLNFLSIKKISSAFPIDHVTVFLCQKGTCYSTIKIILKSLLFSNGFSSKIECHVICAKTKTLVLQKLGLVQTLNQNSLFLIKEIYSQKHFHHIIL